MIEKDIEYRRLMNQDLFVGQIIYYFPYYYDLRQDVGIIVEKKKRIKIRWLNDCCCGTFGNDEILNNGNLYVKK